MNGEKRVTRSEIKITEERYTKSGTREIVTVRKFGGSQPTDDVYAVEVQYTFNDKHLLEKTTVSINSQHILDAFAKLIGSHPTVPSDFSKPFDIESPFQVLCHHWDDLEEYRDKIQDDEARMHLNVLLEFMDIDLGEGRRETNAMTNAGQISYSKLWTIFRPGDMAIEYVNGHPWLLQVRKTAYEESRTIGKYLEIQSTYTDYDGTDVGEAIRVTRILQKGSFGQENPAKITELPIFPRKFLAKGAELEVELEERGARFLQYKGIVVQQYNGLAAYLKDLPPSFYDPDMDGFPLIWLPFAEAGRIIVDRKSFQEDYRPSKATGRVYKEDMDRLTCPPFVYGYSLSRKEWCRFFLADLQDAGWKQDAFGSLILPKSKLQVVRALVSSHKSPRNARNQMDQKGKGLVVLLHGPPGSGKTMTAECAAEETQRALLSTSLPELNKYDSVWWFERQLKELLRLASTWDAVVLFDEADVFLQTDGDSSAGGSASKRDTLVAVFLRHLEYFSGIAFLTTNYVISFDGAMKSRIHLALGYREPDAKSRTLIWANALRRIPAEERDLDIEVAAGMWAQEKFNGRQITNAVNTASTLARFEKAKLQKSHVEAILDMWTEFENGLRPNVDAEDDKIQPLVRRQSILDQEQQQRRF